MVKEKNDYYVYCWIDPTDGHKPFYVGKGKGLRAETHGEVKIDEDKNDHDISAKLKKFKEIRAKGQEPYVRRFMWGLSNDCSHAVETALINTLDGLTNISDGRDLHSIRRKKDFSSWQIEYPGVDFVQFDGELEFLDANDKASRYFKNKLDAIQKTKSNHERVMGSYFIHKTEGIRMWMGDVSDKKWGNTYDEDTGEVTIDLKQMLARHGTWDEIVKSHNEKNTLNANLDKNDPKKNHFLCFMKGLLPNDYVQFVGVYEDDLIESQKRGVFVRKRIATKWKLPV